MHYPKFLKSPLLLALLVLAGSIAYLEIFIRLVGAAPEVGYVSLDRYRISRNPLIGYEPIPHLAIDPVKGFHYDEWLGSKISPGDTNSLGYRDKEHKKAKEPGVYRIVIIGDSITTGWAVSEFKDTYPALLERELNQGKIRVEVINFGVVGYNTQQEVETLKDKGIAFAPDLVILAYCLNDDGPDSGLLTRLLLAERKENQVLNINRLQPFLVHSALYRFMHFRIWSHFEKEGKGRTKSVKDEVNMVYRDTIDQYFKELKTLSDKNHFRVMTLIFPGFASLYESYPHEEEHRRIRQLSHQNGFTTLDLLTSYQECGRGQWKDVAWDNIHPNFAGHRCAAKAIAEAIKKAYRKEVYEHS